MNDNNPSSSTQTEVEKVSGKKEVQAYEDHCDLKAKGCVGFMFQNVNSLGYTPDSVKTLSVRNTLFKNKIDVIMIAETNVNWGEMCRENTLPRICRR